MHSTKNDLPEKTRVKVIALLNDILASAIDLKLRAKQSHWNVKGADFIALHKLLDEVATAFEEFTDLIAERAVALGGGAEGLVPHIQGRSKLGDYPQDISESRDHLVAITSSIAAFGKLTRRAVDQSAAWKDTATADLFTEVTRDLDKHLWFLEAHLQGK
jgi:starvation-inducible DNA-binding protein